MRVGLVVPGFSADQADWCIPALRHMARTLASIDDVRVVAIRFPYRAARYRVDGAQVIALGGADRRGTRTLQVWRTTLDTLHQEHRRRGFDILHAFWATESGLLAALAGRLLRIPTLVSLAGGELVALRDIGYGDQRIAWERLKVAACLRLATAVSAGSQTLMRAAERHVKGKPVHRAPLGVDLDLFQPDGAFNAGVQRLVHVGTLTRVKDQATLVHAFSRLRQAGTRATLEIVGDGPLRTELERLARELGIGDAVCFRGGVDHANLPPIYRSASAFVVSSRHEAQGMVAIEAAACGIPVVGTRVGVMPELTSAVSAPGDADALAASVAATLGDPEPLARAALARARSDFELEACVSGFRRLYARLAAARAPSTSGTGLVCR
jgi:glycosyltransferase involved in cell wall biosynthesis